ncbi:MAG: helical backbone metal receptor [Balneolaceae bacterium]|nr:helical backbone metal receptor [Balneolaceae bacterium]
MDPTPQRIVSLVPSLTELLFDLGAGDRLVGRTRFCVHPKEKVEQVPIIGGTKNPRVDDILELEPDYVVANREENRREDVERLQEAVHVRVTRIATIEEALLAIHEVGGDLGCGESARELTGGISEALEERPDEPDLRTAYCIWKDPWMTVGGDTYIHDVLTHWGLRNVFGSQTRYPRFEPEKLARRHPELVLLSSEPYPFKEKHLQAVEQHVPDARVLLVEGEWFSWYGSRMKHAFRRLNVWRKAIA